VEGALSFPINLFRKKNDLNKLSYIYITINAAYEGIYFEFERKTPSTIGFLTFKLSASTKTLL